MKYCKELTEEICRHLSVGLSVKETCENVGINQDTFYEWQNTKSEFSEVVGQTQIRKADILENQCFKRAMGYAIEEVEHKYNAAGDLIEKKVKRKYIQSDGAMHLLLKANNPEKFKDSTNINLSGDIGLNNLSQEEINERAIALIKTSGISIEKNENKEEE